MYHIDRNAGVDRNIFRPGSDEFFSLFREVRSLSREGLYSLNEAERELGPLKYLAEITGKDMSVVVNWFLLLIIFVFDPLAISMVVAANFAFAQIRRRDEEEVTVTSKGINPEDVKMSVPPGLEYDTPYTLDEIKDAFEKDNPSEELKQRVKENQAKLKDNEIDDMPEESLEEEKWLPELEDENKVILESELEEETLIPEPEENEGKALAKGLDTFIEVLEEEEKEKEEDSRIRRYTNTEPTINENTSAHELYHGDEDTSKTSGEGVKPKPKKVKSVKRIRRTPPRYGSGPIKQRRKK